MNNFLKLLMAAKLTDCGVKIECFLGSAEVAVERSDLLSENQQVLNQEQVRVKQALRVLNQNARKGHNLITF